MSPHLCDKFEFLQESKAYVRYNGLEACSKILVLPHAVEFLFHKKDPEYIKASWLAFIEYMKTKNDLKFPPQRKSDDKREQKYFEFLKKIREQYRNKSFSPEFKREILSWPKGREWVKLKLK